MKKHFQIVFFVFLSFSAFAQNQKDTVVVKKNKCNTGIFISIGINTTQYFSNVFYNYLYNTMGSNIHRAFIPTTDNYKVNSNALVFNYNKSSLEQVLGFGLELNPSRFKKLNHIIETSFMRFSEDYSYSDNFTEESVDVSNGWWADVYDTVQTKYNQTIFNFAYKFQPTFKFIFFSLGINCSVNLIKATQQKKEQINFRGYHLQDPPYAYSQNNISDTANNLHYINFPLQLGVGGCVKIKRVILKPAFYFTPFFIKGYNFYNTSIDILYEFKKH